MFAPRQKSVADPIRTLKRLLVLTIGYFVLGKLSLALAIPPGYATAVWPSAGLALACIIRWGHRFWPGVLLGSTCINAMLRWDGTGATVADALLVGGAIGTGATLQASLGAALVRRWVSEPSRIECDADIIRFFVLGGPVACLVSPSVSMLTLYATGSVPAEELPFSWWTWWVGDTIGVCLLAPLVLLWFDRDLDGWRNRFLPVTTAMGVMTTLVVILFVTSSHYEQRRLSQKFDASASDLVHTIQGKVNTCLSSTQSIGDLHDASQSVERQEFSDFVRRTLEGSEAIAALAWAPVVTHAEREGFEDQLKRIDLAPVGISQPTPEGMRQAPDRDFYVPVLFSEPVAEVGGVIGYDLMSNPMRRDALQRAWNLGILSATGPVDLVTGGLGLVVFQPVEGKPRDGQTEPVAGFAIGVLRIDELIKGLRRIAYEGSTRLEIDDISDPAAPQMVYRDPGAAAEPSGISHTTIASVAGRSWRIKCTPGTDFAAASRTWTPWGVLAGGLAITCLLSAMMLITSGRAAEVQRLVEKRTIELAEVNRELAGLAETAHRFVDNVAHDFRTPLTVIKAFNGVLVRGLGKVEAEVQVDQLGYVRRATDELTQMVDDFLDSSKLKHKVLPVDRRDRSVEELFGHVRETVATRAINQQIRIVEDIAPGLPRVHCDLNKAGRILVNLAVNAIKFSNDCADVVISARDKGESVVISVTDTGPGIPEEKLATLCERFSQVGGAQPLVEKGFGLGLSIAKELVQLNLGEMCIESEVGVGSTFSFSLPTHDPLAILNAYLDTLGSRSEPMELVMIDAEVQGPQPDLQAIHEYIADTTYAMDLVMPMVDGTSVRVLGATVKPQSWADRLRAGWIELHPDRPLSVTMIRIWQLPQQRRDVIDDVLQVGQGV